MKFFELVLFCNLAFVSQSHSEEECLPMAPNVLNNTYFYGELIAVSKDISQEGCVDLCKKEKDCVSINYCVESTTKCELLKDELVRGVANNDDYGSNSNCVYLNNINVCSKDSGEDDKIRSKKATKPICGRSNIRARQSLQRIVGGYESKPNSFPWIVSISQRNNHYCGGSLISVGNDYKSDIVITAAHCLFGVKPNMLTLKLGCTDISQNNCIKSTADKFDPHPNFNFENGTNDIALIRLTRPVSFNNVVRPICRISTGAPNPGTVCVAAGWGSIFENGPGSSRLRQVELPIIDTKTCNGPNFYKGQLDTKAMLCAGYSEGQKDSCQGDSGGPLMMKNGDSYVLVGVVSFGEGCARPNFPGIYTNLQYYGSWVDERMKKLSAVVKQIF